MGEDFKWSEAAIVRAISLQTFHRKCLLLLDNCYWTGHECDVLGVTNDLRIIDIEVKISRTDLKADAKKDKWWHQRAWRWNEEQPPRTARVWPPKVWKHYYAMPADLWTADLLDCLPSPASGVLLLSRGRNHQEPPVIVKCTRRATPNKLAERIAPEAAVDIARLANLRMWDSYAELESARRQLSDALVERA